jgi:TPR repeat protein
VEATFLSGLCYLFGCGTRRNANKAWELICRAHDEGYCPATVILADLVEEGFPGQPDPEKALQLMSLAGERGYFDAQYDLGIRYRKGVGVRKDDDKAVEWFQKAAEQDDPRAQFYLGQCYQGGWGVKKDATEAFRWYYRAATLGHLSAQEKIRQRAVGGRFLLVHSTSALLVAPVCLLLANWLDLRLALILALVVSAVLSISTMSLMYNSATWTSKQSIEGVRATKLFLRLYLGIIKSGWVIVVPVIAWLGYLPKIAVDTPLKFVLFVGFGLFHIAASLFGVDEGNIDHASGEYVSPLTGMALPMEIIDLQRSIFLHIGLGFVLYAVGGIFLTGWTVYGLVGAVIAAASVVAAMLKTSRGSTLTR